MEEKRTEAVEPTTTVEQVISRYLRKESNNKNKNTAEEEEEGDSNGWMFYPKTFFFAFGGVPCLVMEGFPPECETLKADLNSAISSCATSSPNTQQQSAADVSSTTGGDDDAEITPLSAVKTVKENLGSMWAKISLGALRRPKTVDGAAGLLGRSSGSGDGAEQQSSQSTTPPTSAGISSVKDCAQLRDLCTRVLPPSSSSQQQPLKIITPNLHIVQYKNRALSNRIRDRRIPITSSYDSRRCCPVISDRMAAKTMSVIQDFFSSTAVAAPSSLDDLAKQEEEENKSRSLSATTTTTQQPFETYCRECILAKPQYSDAYLSDLEPGKEGMTLVCDCFSFIDGDGQEEADTIVSSSSSDATANGGGTISSSRGSSKFSGNLATLRKIQEFQGEVDKLFPDTFDWFPIKALHITIRGL